MQQFTETLRKLRMSLIGLAKVLKNLRQLHFNNKGADQPVQTRSLISDVVVQSLESISKSAKRTLAKTCRDISNMLMI